MKTLSKFMLSTLVLLATFFTFTLTHINAEDNNDAPEHEVILIYAHLPEGWSNPHVWTWNDAGDSAFANLGWPGKAMIADEDNEGWYYLYIPANMENVIINANDAGVQTDAFPVDGENVWVTITLETVEEEEVVQVDVSLEKATDGELPEYVPTKYIYAYIPIDWDTAGLWAWEHPAGTGLFSTWPGEEMTLLSDGWFRMEIPTSMNRVIINNFESTDTLQTVDIEIGEGDVYIVVGDEDEDGKFEVTLHDTKPIIIEDGFTVTITVPSTWDAPSVWAWSHPDGTNLFPSWPGEPLVFDEDANAYVIIVPEWINRIIINNGIVGEGAVQTVDLVLENPVDTFIVIGEVDGEGKYTATVTQEGDEPGDEDPNDEDPNGEEPTDEDPADDDEDDEDGVNVALITLGIVGGLAIIGLAVLFVLKKKA